MAKSWGLGGGLCCCNSLQFVCAELIEHLHLEEVQKVILLTSLVWITVFGRYYYTGLNNNALLIFGKYSVVFINPLIDKWYTREFMQLEVKF